MKELIGKIINKIFVSEKDQDYLRFETNEGNLDYYAAGDCCSESYFSDVNRTKYLFGHLVEEVIEVDLMPEEVIEIESRQDIDEIYGFRIKTNKGIGLVVMRNSSNGYYGGEVVKIDKIPENERMFEITRDFCVKDLFSQKTYEKRNRKN